MGEICKRGDDGRNQKTLSLPPPRSSRTGVGDVNDNDGVGVGVGDVDDNDGVGVGVGGVDSMEW